MFPRELIERHRSVDDVAEGLLRADFVPVTSYACRRVEPERSVRGFDDVDGDVTLVGHREIAK